MARHGVQQPPDLEQDLETVFAKRLQIVVTLALRATLEIPYAGRVLKALAVCLRSFLDSVGGQCWRQPNAATARNEMLPVFRASASATCHPNKLTDTQRPAPKAGPLQFGKFAFCTLLAYSLHVR